MEHRRERSAEPPVVDTDETIMGRFRLGGIVDELRPKLDWHMVQDGGGPGVHASGR